MSEVVSPLNKSAQEEYQAQQKLEAQKKQASVPTGEQVATTQAETLTRDYAINNYQKAVKKFGMDKVDEIIMKG